MLGQQKSAKLHYIGRLDDVFSRTFPRKCPICRYRGFFLSSGLQNRPEAMCPQCGSVERHRLLYLAITQHERCMLAGKNVLHFAPERCIEGFARRAAKSYFTTDLSTGNEALDITHNVDFATDMTNIGLSNNALDVIICNHVLDQVSDDTAALKELFRIIRPHGVAIITVQVVDGWEKTFEDPSIQSDLDRLKYYDHQSRVRYYGRDFVTRMESAGFVTEIFQPHFSTYSEYGLIAGDKIFIGHKPITSVEDG